MDDAQVKQMVDRFLMWRLPEDFHPDNGISFKPTFNDWMDPPMRHDPVGTNLLNAEQTEAMVRFMVEGLSTRPHDENKQRTADRPEPQITESDIERGVELLRLAVLSDPPPISETTLREFVIELLVSVCPSLEQTALRSFVLHDRSPYRAPEL